MLILPRRSARSRSLRARSSARTRCSSASCCALIARSASARARSDSFDGVLRFGFGAGQRSAQLTVDMLELGPIGLDLHRWPWSPPSARPRARPFSRCKLSTSCACRACSALSCSFAVVRMFGLFASSIGLAHGLGLGVADPDQRDDRCDDEQREQRDRARDGEPARARGAIGEPEHRVEIRLFAARELAAIRLRPAPRIVLGLASPQQRPRIGRRPPTASPRPAGARGTPRRPGSDRASARASATCRSGSRGRARSRQVPSRLGSRAGARRRGDRAACARPSDRRARAGRRSRRRRACAPA